jgi:hypothetical protein
MRASQRDYKLAVQPGGYAVWFYRFDDRSSNPAYPT